MSESLVVAGNGMAATRSVGELMQLSLGRYSVIVIGAEPRLSYNRVLLSSLLAGEVSETAIELKPRGWWNGRGVTTLDGQAVVSIDRENQKVTLAALLKRAIEAMGVEVSLGADTKRVLGEDRATGLELSCGRILPGDFVVCAVGIRPHVQLGRDAGLVVNHGIAVGDGLATSDPNIFALGECAEHRNNVYGLVEPAYEQAKVLARRLAGHSAAVYSGLTLATNLNISGVNLFSAGKIMESSSSNVLRFEDDGAGIYKKLVIENRRLKGAVLFGDTADGLWYLDLIRSGADVMLAFGPALALSQAA